VPNTSPLRRSFPVVAWTILLLLASLLPGREMPRIDAPDKLAHGIMYFVYTFLVARYLLKRYRTFSVLKSFLIALIYAISFGAIIEAIQAYFIPMRNGDVMDVAANTAGALLAMPFFMIIHRKG
jgi:VanZ family protein